MKDYQKLLTKLGENQYTWLVTGCAGFIGSNLVEALLNLNQKVIGLDNFSTGHSSNIKNIELAVKKNNFKNFKFIEGDICDIRVCQSISKDVNYVLHQAALGSVPRSLLDPIKTNQVNISGFLNIMIAARDQGVDSLVYAASSSTYGDHPDLPKTEDKIGKPLSPYAVSKYVNELYADIFYKNFNFDSIGLRYFNVFGRRQDPNGAYAAVIPKWINAMQNMSSIQINGDGSTSRDFCYIDNVIQANLLAATACEESKNQVYNIAVGDSTSLNQLFKIITDILGDHKIHYSLEPKYADFREGDVKHSQANIDKAKKMLGYEPQFNVKDGLKLAISWYLKNL